MFFRKWKLHQAAKKGDIKKVKSLLLEKKVKVDTQDNEGLTALQWASACGHLEVIELLLERGAKSDAQDNNRVSALSVASLSGQLNFFLKKGQRLMFKKSRV